ncbi:hypothetical protein CC85DRAFT_307904 [Cutaneotrichosporon oleaginosum]|uniref:tRNA-splicing endonuclease subunit Sen54 N-terminal domain-containing protein n=1 Tax=Cutaneotrichosporon oleaginosum TaxID=879819 RepID=A0A0J0XNV9_9TREE|nr:uncharacterized protein CC85DRAFT_307904 [Cutaneotrichosporon oleaginosum]KLT42826.1 hypothetical protein CC85DRAFT_307904 [Cutaneotrichosporon oleaginosum]TXT08208.1 hypothetical protein COLE_05132 [Cutaneotrichosporon oleaginosum]
MAGAPPPTAHPQQEGDDEDDEGHMDVQFIRGFADKIQRVPQELQDDPAIARPKINIPKRGEKDFEPLAETVNLQEMMLQNSRQALFDALQGVRGVASKSLSHALITPASPFPQLIISRGHVLDTLGITVRPAGGGKGRIELLPEEALYLAERGSLQIWNGMSPTQEEPDLGTWSEEEFGVRGAVEMSVLECFSAFMGMEGLSWQRYQAYAYLKRLGYTVQRTRRFIPAHFLPVEEPVKTGVVAKIAGLWARLCGAVSRLLAAARAHLPSLRGGVTGVGLALGRVFSSNPLRATILGSWSGQTYSSIFTHIRFIPAGHTHPVPSRLSCAAGNSQYSSLVDNPYLPFFHVWKPVTSWSKAKWDRGSPAGLANQRPDYAIAAVESRNTPMPTLWQLNEVFHCLPDEPKGPPRRVGPQYENRRPHLQRVEEEEAPASWFHRIVPWLRVKAPMERQHSNPMAEMRNGDRAFIVAVNDSGNTGWVRFGRSGFESFPMV